MNFENDFENYQKTIEERRIRDMQILLQGYNSTSGFINTDLQKLLKNRKKGKRDNLDIIVDDIERVGEKIQPNQINICCNFLKMLNEYLKRNITDLNRAIPKAFFKNSLINNKESLEELSLRVSQLIKVCPASFQTSEGGKKYRNKTQKKIKSKKNKKTNKKRKRTK